MDEMHVKGILFQSLLEVLIKRWVKKKTGVALDISVHAMSFDLSGDEYRVGLDVSGKLNPNDKKKILTAINPFV